MALLNEKFIGIFLLPTFFFYGVMVGKYEVFPFYLIQTSKDFFEANISRFSSKSYSGIFDIQCQNNQRIESIEFLEYQIRLVNKNAPFSARDGADAVFHENKLFLLSGWNGEDKEHFPKYTSNDVWISQDFGIS